jgi:hypothetical protein
MKLEVLDDIVIRAEIEVDGVISRHDIDDWIYGIFDIKTDKWDFEIVGAQWPEPKLIHDIENEDNFS